MNFSTYKEYNAARDETFRACARNYIIGCAEPIVELIPVLDFRDALAAFKLFTTNETQGNRNLVKRMLRRLDRLQDFYTNRSAFGCLCATLRFCLRFGLNPPTHLTNSCTFGFSEAYSQLAYDMEPFDGKDRDYKEAWEERARTASDKRRWECWQKAFLPMEEFWNTPWLEYKKSLKAA